MPAKKRSNTSANRRRRGALTNVTPIAVKATTSSNAAAIPVSIKSTGDSPEAEAVIPVEVKDASGKTRHRAARVPVRLKAAKSHQTRRSRSARKHTVKSRRTRYPARRKGQYEQKATSGRQDLLTRGLMALTDVEETAVNLAGQASIKVLQTVPPLLRFGLSIPFALAEGTADRAQQAYSNLSETVEELYSEASEEVEQLAA